MNTVIYFDNNATTQVAPEVVEVMMPFFSEYYGNASSMHTFGGAVGRYIQNAREQVASLIGAEPEEVFFTSCGTESDASAIWSAIQLHPEKRHIITTRVEHAAILSVCNNLESKGYKVTYLDVDNKGRLDLDELRSSITHNTAIVSIMYANNETGTIFPIQQIAEIVKEKDVLFHTDAVQAVGKIPVDLKALNIDYLSLSGHKIHAPKGIGAFYVKTGTRYRPYLRGGHQEFNRRAGTENVPYVIGLGKAAELAQDYLEKTNGDDIKVLRDNLEKQILTITDTVVNGDIDNRVPNTTNISFRNIEGEAILLLMDQHGICASSGSACTSGSLEPSHVLRAMGVPFTYAHGSIRFSLSRYSTADEVNIVVKELPAIIERLREISPFKIDT
ncbi:cysteine desulfurase NifS [Lawsonia intracellularis]|uniref:Cysteine desulfurase n=1 Tax=Lawsonia intracellularis (strain PHE/MN1-00) TaxID=363253 RepID=Q1MRQ5_LAWIP|nr:cysteine desulfurase NifS [Lawsonia intracellularis]AGC49674.1 cysteine desulfurase [Lawsonia intracellularis N343]KAA0205179.1 cysteine desulfurase NifS [Lawsonia intracellularis]MBZ3892292.1 cysteine desulfurase NifS [Lawsonia intracellularis]RBN32274.1 cysteine desulfurase NifS [Lawsonia intracellularis]RBN33841.1 cysteine desulfurase NifS [Lawsonia intracellularis]